MATVGIVNFLIGVSAVAAVGGAVSARRAGKEQRKQNEIQNRIAATRRVRNIRRSIAQSRIQRGQTEAAGFQFGVSGGTAVQGAVSGITGDLGSAIGAANQQFTGQQAIAASQNRISQFQQQAATFGAISSLAGQFNEQNIAAITNLAG
jgi:hypothetical protein